MTIQTQIDTPIDNSHCGGRLSFASGTPITTSPINSASTVYWTPYKSNLISLYSSSSPIGWKIYSFTQISALASTFPGTDIPHDIFVFNNSGTLQIVGEVWSTITARAVNLAVQDGIYVSGNNPNYRYVGTVFRKPSVDFVDNSDFCTLWNYYNRVDAKLNYSEPTTDWDYTTATFRPSNGNNASSVQFVVGISEDSIFSTANSVATNPDAGGAYFQVGIGVNSTSVNSAIGGGMLGGLASSAAEAITCTYSGYPGIGINTLYWLEYSLASGTTSWEGTASPTQTGIIVRTKK